jgi:hypothetical protein
MESIITHTPVCASFKCAENYWCHPFNLMFGREACPPIDLQLNLPVEECLTDKHADQLRDGLNHAYRRVRSHMELHTRYRKYDQHARKYYHVNEEVWLHNPVAPRGSSRKIHRSWRGPFKIVERLGEVLYKIQQVNDPLYTSIHSSLSTDVQKP